MIGVIGKVALLRQRRFFMGILHRRVEKTLRAHPRGAGNTHFLSHGDAAARAAGNTGPSRNCRATACVQSEAAPMRAKARARSALYKIGSRSEPYPSLTTYHLPLITFYQY